MKEKKYNNLEVGQILYILMSDKTTFKKVEITKIIKDCDREIDPARYMRIITKDVKPNPRGTMTFYPEHFNRIVFTSEKDVRNCIKESFDSLVQEDWMER